MTTDSNPNPVTVPDAKALLALARQQAHVYRVGLVANKSVVTAEELMLALGGVSMKHLDETVQANKIFTLEVAGKLYYPAFYAAENVERPQLERVIQALVGLDGWQQWQFFTTPKASLSGLTPLQALQDHGVVAAVVRAASGFAER